MAWLSLGRFFDRGSTGRPELVASFDFLEGLIMYGRSALVRGSLGDEAYGLTHEGCLGSVLSICVYRSDDHIHLSALRNIGRVIPSHPENVMESLTKADWVRLTRLVKGADFWALPKTRNAGGLDGWSWTIEGRKGKRYHSAESWCASVSPAFENLGCFLVKLSGLSIPEDIP